MSSFASARLEDAPGKNVCFNCIDGKVWSHLNVLWYQSEYVFDFSEGFDGVEIFTVNDFPYERAIVQKCVNAFYDHLRGSYTPDPLYEPKMYDVFDYLIAKPYFLRIDNYDSNGETSELFNLRKEAEKLRGLYDCFKPILSNEIKFLGKRKYRQLLERESGDSFMRHETVPKLVKRRLQTILFGSRSTEQYDKLITEFNDDTTSYLPNSMHYSPELMKIMAAYGIMMPYEQNANMGDFFTLIGMIPNPRSNRREFVLIKLNVPEDIPLEFFGDRTYYKPKSDSRYLRIIEEYQQIYNWISVTDIPNGWVTDYQRTRYA
jgi:hypothetical protein